MKNINKPVAESEKMKSRPIDMENNVQEHTLQIKKLQTLLDISVGLHKSGSFEEVGKTIHENLIKFKIGNNFQTKLGIFRSHTNSFSVVSDMDNQQKILDTTGESINNTYHLNEIDLYGQESIRLKKTLVINDNHAEYALKIDNRQKELSRRSMIFIPMFNHDTFVGLFSFMQNPENSIREDFIVFLENIMNFVCIKISEILSEERKKIAEKKLLENEIRWQFALEGNGEDVWSWNIQTGEVFFSRRWKEMVGYKGNEVVNNLNEWKRRVHPGDIKRVCKEINNHIDNNSPIFASEYRILCEDGDYKWILNRGRVSSWSEDGKPRQIIGTHIDISEKKYREEELFRLRIEQQAVLDNLPFSIWLKDVSGKFLAVNKIFSEYCGYPQEYITGKTDFDIFPVELAKKYRKGDEDFIKNKKPLSFEDKVLINGKTVWHEVFMSPIFDRNGEVLATTGVTKDITERKLSEAAIRKSEERLRLITDNMVDIMSQVEKNRIFIFVSPSIKKSFGYEIQDILGKDSFEFINPEHHDRFIKIIEGAITHKKYSVRVEYQFRKKSGEYIWVESEVNVLYGSDEQYIGAVIGTRDIDKRKKAEMALKESEDRFQRVTENTMVIIFRMSLPSQTFEYISPVVKEVYGYSPEEVYRSQVLLYRCIHPDWRDLIKKQLRGLSKGVCPSNFEFQIMHRSGLVKWVHQKNVLIFNEKGNPIAVEGVVSDVTEIKLAVEALSEEKERLSVTLRSIGDGVITTDTEGKILLLNRVAEQLTGYFFEEAVGKHLSEVFNIVNQLTREKCENPVEKILKSGGIINLENHTVLISKKGIERTISDSGAPIRDKDSKIIGLVLVFRDITERERMEQELLKKQKLESVGILAGGIAHDFNNFLTAILGNIQVVKLKGPNLEIDKYLLSAEKATLRAKSLTQQLLTFSKGGSPVVKPGSINELLKDTTQFTLRGSSILYEFELPQNIWKVKMDEGQISQVVQNIVINAKEAMPLGGKIIISAENIEVEKINPNHLEPGKYVKVSIQDTGMGISMEFLSRIFEPYFTTKEQGHGLGLAVCYSIILNHNGHLTADSELEKGTKFTFYLPAVNESVKTEDDYFRSLQHGIGKILVMDDDEMVGEIACSILEELGYKAILCKDGSEAVDYYKKSFEQGVPFDVVIMDLTVPGGIGGEETIKQLLEIDNKVIGVVSSGYSNDPIMANYQKFGFSGAIVKPYEIMELSTLIGNLIQR